MKQLFFLLCAVALPVAARSEPLTLRQAVAPALEKSPELAVYSVESK